MDADQWRYVGMQDSDDKPKVHYWQETRRPLVSLAFVAPMLLVYEGGILLLGPEAMRNGADVWLRQFLDWIGFGQYFLLPILTVCILLAWHHMRREPWQFCGSVVYGMLTESAAFGLLLLLLIAPLLESAASSVSIIVAVSGRLAQFSGKLVGYFGAGIYEELLFRLMLLPVVAGLVRWAGASQRASLNTAIVTTSLLFSAAHYSLFTSAGEPFDWFSFVFRFLAGVFFALIFTYRGFGIAAGSHTLYDIFQEMLPVG